jgi:hypothetical protein
MAHSRRTAKPAGVCAESENQPTSGEPGPENTWLEEDPRREVSGEGDGGSAAPSSLTMEADSANDSPDSSTTAEKIATVRMAAPDEERGRFDEDSNKDDYVSQGIATKASLAHAIDRVRELKTRWPRPTWTR